jgi:cell division protein FtsX
MIGNIIWCALTNIRRMKAVSVLLFILSLLIAGTLFLGLIAVRYLGLPDLADLGRFFSAFVFVITAADAVVLFAIALFFAHSRRQEIGIYRIHGARKADILFLNALEILFVSFSGAFAGVLLALLLIACGALDLPSFFEGTKGVTLIATGGQIIFGVSIIEIAVTSIYTAHFLQKGDANLMRGSL